MQLYKKDRCTMIELDKECKLFLYDLFLSAIETELQPGPVSRLAVHNKISHSRSVSVFLNGGSRINERFVTPCALQWFCNRYSDWVLLSTGIVVATSVATAYYVDRKVLSLLLVHAFIGLGLAVSVRWWNIRANTSPS